MSKPTQVRFWRALQTLWTGAKLVQEGEVFQSAAEWAPSAAVLASAPRAEGEKKARPPRVMTAEEFFAAPAPEQE